MRYVFACRELARLLDSRLDDLPSPRNTIDPEKAVTSPAPGLPREEEEEEEEDESAAEPNTRVVSPSSPLARMSGSTLASHSPQGSQPQEQKSVPVMIPASAAASEAGDRSSSVSATMPVMTAATSPLSSSHGERESPAVFHDAQDGLTESDDGGDGFRLSKLFDTVGDAYSGTRREQAPGETKTREESVVDDDRPSALTTSGTSSEVPSVFVGMAA
jgi:hypothetical protein